MGRWAWASRVALLGLVGLGLWLWHTGPGPHERTFVWSVEGPAMPIRSTDVQIWSGDGRLLKRAETFEGGRFRSEFSATVPLSRGRYQAQALIQTANGSTLTSSEWVSVGESTTYRISVPSTR